MTQQEGVIQFDLAWRAADPVAADLAALNAWRQVLWKLELIGEDPDRYQGYGFGNVSQRLGSDNRFVISGTQTGHMPLLENRHYALVTGCDPAHNHVDAEGPVRPSSESMTHGVLYALDPGIACVLHVHSPEIWHAAAELALPQTRAEVAYGTPDMAREVERLFRETDVLHTGIFTMAGHRDGVVAFGGSPEQAGVLLVTTLARSSGG